jgi:hypothetical protein
MHSQQNTNKKKKISKINHVTENAQMYLTAFMLLL